jgi:DNA-directed RNA polymerase subunit RPC12/RpoP
MTRETNSKVLHCFNCGCRRLFKPKVGSLLKKRDSIFCIACNNEYSVSSPKNISLLKAEDKERIKRIFLRRF